MLEGRGTYEDPPSPKDLHAVNGCCLEKIYLFIFLSSVATGDANAPVKGLSPMLLGTTLRKLIGSHKIDRNADRDKRR